MDIISMQIANKVLKRMNTEFNGLYDIVIATEGQKVFNTTKAHDIQNHGLHVYVNGYHAVEEQDYTHTDQNSIEFKNPLRRGDVILMSTQIVGIPKFEVINPEYDDTTVKSEILSINGKISAIINALDEDADGSIIDTIADIKKQWKDADSNLVKLIEQKASAEELSTLKAKVEGIVIPPAYNDEHLVARVGALEGATTELEEKVLVIEAGSSVKELFINDDETGRQHVITLRKGVLLVKATGLPLEITQTGPIAGVLNEAQEFKLNILANVDLNQKVKLVVTHTDKVKLEYKNLESWELFDTRTIESLTNTDYTLRITGLETGQHPVTFDIVRFDNNAELGDTSFSIQVSEPQIPIVTEQERVVTLLQDSTTAEITLGEDITLGDITLGCNKTLNLNSLSARLDGATDVGTFKITSIGGGAVYFDSNFTLTGDGEGDVIIDNSENTVSYRMGTLAEIPAGYAWEENIFKKNVLEASSLTRKSGKK